MPITNRTDFHIYNDEFHGGMLESLTQYAGVFNEGSNGAIRLLTADMIGDYRKETFFKSLGQGMITRQDTTSNDPVPDTKITDAEHVEVKLFRKINPYTTTYNAFRAIGADPSEFSYIVGQQAGQAMVREMLNTVIKATRAAISGIASNVKDATADTLKSISHENLLDMFALFGDNSDRIKALVMHSKQWFDLQKQGLADGYETIATGILNSHYVPAFNRPIIVTDSPSLVDTTPSPDEYYVLGLTDGAAVASKIDDVQMLLDPISGEEQLRVRLQGEYSYAIGLKGVAYDTTAGPNPTDTAIGTAANWDQVVTSPYDTPGALLKVNPKV
ncbi:MAG: major capsid protein [Pyrinomonadaceae bacterium]